MLTSRIWVATLLMTLGLGLTTPLSTSQEKAGVKQYMYVLRVVPRLHKAEAWTDVENAAVSAHFKRLKDALAKRTVILAGRTNETLDRTFGIVIFEAKDDSAARDFMDEDPAVASGVMTAVLHPYSVALLRE